MQRYHDCPQILREFLIYHETIKGQSPLTISEYYLDLRMFLRFVKLMRCEMPINTDMETINIKDVDLAFLQENARHFYKVVVLFYNSNSTIWLQIATHSLPISDIVIPFNFI